jgi:hypothetical protein
LHASARFVGGLDFQARDFARDFPLFPMAIPAIARATTALKCVSACNFVQQSRRGLPD